MALFNWLDKLLWLPKGRKSEKSEYQRHSPIRYSRGRGVRGRGWTGRVRLFGRTCYLHKMEGK